MSESEMVKTKEFELPNGMKVELSDLDDENYDRLTEWIRREYIKNVRSVLGELTEEERETVLYKAVKDAAMMSSRNAEGLKILFKTIHGFSRVCYEMIRNPPISFEEFNRVIFPSDAWIGGLDVLRKMHSLVGGGKFGGVELSSNANEKLQTIMMSKRV